MSERVTKELLDHSLYRVAGGLGSAMKHAHKLGDTALYENLRSERLKISNLRDKLNRTSAVTGND